LSASASRPAYLDEFERKLAAALAQQEAKKARLPSSDANFSASSSPSVGESLTCSSIGGDAERPLNVSPLLPSSETRKGRTPSHKAAAVQRADSAVPVGAVTAPLAGGRGTVGASGRAGQFSQRTPFGSTIKLPKLAAPDRDPVAPPADLADASCSHHPSQPVQRTEELTEVPVEAAETAAVAAEVLQAFADAFEKGGGKGPEKRIAAAEPVVIEAAPVMEAADFQAHEMDVAQDTKRGSQGWKFKALVFAVSVAIIGALFMRVGGMLAPLSEPSTAATGPNQRENMTPDQGAAQQAQSAEVPSPSAASSAGSDLLKDRPEVNSAAVVATPTAPQAAKTAAVDTIRPAGGLSSETLPALIVSTPGAATPATPPLAQSSDIKPVPTVSPPPAPTASPISSAAFPIDASSEGTGPQPTAERTGNVHELGTTNPSAPRRDVRSKVVGKLSTRAVVTKNDATSPHVAVQTHAKHHNSAEPKAVQGTLKSSTEAPAATSQLNGIY
jgi:hypothetical protein